MSSRKFFVLRFVPLGELLLESIVLLAPTEVQLLVQLLQLMDLVYKLLNVLTLLLYFSISFFKVFLKIILSVK